MFLLFFFFNDTATTEIYTLSLHDALPICRGGSAWVHEHLHRGATVQVRGPRNHFPLDEGASHLILVRSEEHTSELQSRLHLVCRLLLEKKKKAPCDIPIRASPRIPVWHTS